MTFKAIKDVLERIKNNTLTFMLAIKTGNKYSYQRTKSFVD